MEIVIAIAIVGILAGAIGPLAFRQIQKAKEEATRRELDSICAAIGEYHDDTGALPASLTALVADDGRAGWEGPYLGSDWNDPVAQVTRDAFERNYSYVLSPNVLPAGSADLIIASAGVNHSIDLQSGNSWNLANISQVDDIVVHISASRLNRDKQRETVTELEALAEAARNYYRDNSSFPPDLSSLSGSHIDTGFNNDSFVDEWRSDYHSSIQGSGENAVLNIWSSGPDRQNDSGGGDDLELEINASAIETGQGSGEEEEELSETEREVRDIQDALDANPHLNIRGSIGQRDLQLLGLGNNYRRDEWDRSYRVTSERQAFSSGPDRNRRTHDDNIPQGVGD